MLDPLASEFEELKVALNLPPEEFYQLDAEISTKIINRVKHRFVENTRGGWWWESFGGNASRYRFMNSDGYKILADIIPNDVALWFIADGFKDRIVYEGIIKHIQMIIAQSEAIREYYLVPKDLAWLVCYNHHDILYTIGEPVETRLNALDIER